MYNFSTHKDFVKDLKKAKLNQTNLEKLFMYISILLNKGKLPKPSNDHKLNGDWLGFREFHISGDLLVIYRINGDTLELIRIGSHSQLF